MLGFGPLAYARENAAHFEEELNEFLRLPTVSAESRRSGDQVNCARWLAKGLATIGFEDSAVAPAQRAPVVYGHWLGAGPAPTVLLYGHYDVSPAGEGDGWHSPPFEPTLRGSNLYARGASDDKGQLFAWVKALESCLLTTGRLPVNVKCLFEGEGEIGSPSLPAFLARNRGRLAADVAVVSDTAMLGPDRPALTHALRGVLTLEIAVERPGRDLHSGLYGGAVPDVLQALCRIVASLHDAEGRVAIPGFYGTVRRWDQAERAYMARNGPSGADLLRGASVPSGSGEPGYTPYERVGIRPSLSVTGMAGGYRGSGHKAVLPARARARFEFRLVPDQEPDEIEALVRAHVRRLAPAGVAVDVTRGVAVAPALLDSVNPWAGAAVRACRRGFGAPPVRLRSGGTIPVVNLLRDIFGAPVLLLGFGLPDDGAHGPDEKIHLPTFHRAVATGINFLAELAAIRPPATDIGRPPCYIERASPERSLPW